MVAANGWWHRKCFRCSHKGCGLPLGEHYYMHESKVFCLEHYQLRTSEACAGCGKPVGHGLRALGRVWHEGCLKCDVSGAPITLGGDQAAKGVGAGAGGGGGKILKGKADFYLHHGRAVCPEEFERGSVLCAVCKKPAPTDRVYALGRFMHSECFTCAHSKQASLIQVSYKSRTHFLCTRVSLPCFAIYIPPDASITQTR